MGEGVAMRHTCIRRGEDAEELGPQEGAPLGGEGLDPSPLPERHEKPGHEGYAPTPSLRGGGGADALRPAPLLRMVQSSRR